jgi:hypothetical protein
MIGSGAFSCIRTSLAPVAAALANATADYADHRMKVGEAHIALCKARVKGAQNVSAIADQSDAAVEAMSASQEKVATLMADLHKAGVLNRFYAFAAAQSRNES